VGQFIYPGKSLRINVIILECPGLWSEISPGFTAGNREIFYTDERNMDMIKTAAGAKKAGQKR